MFWTNSPSPITLLVGLSFPSVVRFFAGDELHMSARFYSVFIASVLALALGQRLYGAPASVKGDKDPQENGTARTDLYGDPLPAGAVARLGTVRFRQGGIIYCLALSTDGKKMASGGNDAALVLWDAATGKEIRRFRGHDGYVKAVAISPNGKLLASGSFDRTLRLWDVTTGKEIRRLGNFHGLVNALVFLPDGKTLISGSEDRVARQWDVTTGKERQTFYGHEAAILSAAVSGDGKTLVTGGADRIVRVWDIATAKELHSLAGHQGTVLSVALSRDGKTLASAAGDDAVRIWDPATGKLVQQLQVAQQKLSQAALSADGKVLAAWSSAKTIRLWSLPSGKELAPCTGHIGVIYPLVFTPNGKTLISAGREGIIRFWDTATGKEVRPAKGHLGVVKSLTIAPDSKTIATACTDGKVRMWDAATGKEIRSFTAHANGVFSIVFSPDGKKLATAGSDGVALWEAASGKSIHKFAVATGTTYWLPVAYSPDSKSLVMGGRSVRVLDPERNLQIRQLGGTGPWSSAVVISPDSKTVAAAGTGKIIHLWNLATGQELRTFTGHTGPIQALAFAPDGKTLASGTGDRTVRLWEVATGKERQVFYVAANARMFQFTFVAISPDSKIIAAGSQDFSIHLWDAATGKELHRLTGATGPARSLFFSPDGKRLVSSGDDTTALVWDVSGVGKAAPRRPVKLEPKEMQAYWKDLSADNPIRAFRAHSMLLRAPQQAVAHLKEHLRPIAAADVEIPRLLKNLDDDDFKVREKASRALEELGELAEMALRDALKNPASVEVEQRVERLLAKLQKGRGSGGPSAERLRLLRSLEALEHINTAEARDLLRSLAKGAPEAWLTQEAKSSLDRLARQAADKS
jgi:WD40 repeat protein